MYSQKRSSKSKSLKRKVRQDLQQLLQEEKVRRIIEGPVSYLADDESFVPPATADQVVDSNERNSSTESHTSSKSNGLIIDKDPVESPKLVAHECSNSEHKISENSTFVDCADSGSDINNYLFSSNDEDSVSETELPNDTLTLTKASLRDKLITWTRQFHIRNNALSASLKILKEENDCDLPSDSRTLLKTVRKSKINTDTDGSETSYFGLMKGLCTHDLNKICGSDREIALKINIDGLPISKSTGGQFWPILCQIVSHYPVSPFLVACYHGKNKPTSVHKYLEPFIQELNHLQFEGFDYFGTFYIVSIHSLICDAPARAFVKCIKGHGGFYGCEKCTQRGSSVNGRVVFLETEAEKRTDESFRLKLNTEHHTGTSPFTELNFGFVSQVPLDYMHLVLLGAMRKLLLFWIRNGDRKSVRIAMNQVSAISEKLSSLADHTPSEFSRKPRSLKDLDRFKATELRQILLYTGPIVFCNILPDRVYKHFLIFHVAISTLADDVKVQDPEQIIYAEGLLKYFVQEMKAIYKEESLSYNIHNLIHITDDVRRFGCLDNFSCFPFENYLFQLKNMLHTPNRPLSQLCRRESENRIEGDKEVTALIKLCHPHNKGPCLTLHGAQFHEVVYNGSIISTTNERDSFVQLSNKKIVKVLNIIQTNCQTDDPNTIYIVCVSYYNHGDYYSYPCSSECQSIYRIGRPMNKMVCRKLSRVAHKCIVSHELNVAVALIHQIF